MDECVAYVDVLGTTEAREHGMKTGGFRSGVSVVSTNRSARRFAMVFALIGTLLLQFAVPAMAIADSTPEPQPEVTVPPATEPEESAVPVPTEPDQAGDVQVENSVPVDLEDDSTAEDVEVDTIETEGVTTEDVVIESTEEVSIDENANSPPADTETMQSTPSMEEEQMPTPTEESALPFNPRIECRTSPGSTAPIAGATGWSLLDCSINWDTRHVSAVSVLPIEPTVEWQVVPLNDPLRQDPNALSQNPRPLDLIDLSAEGELFQNSRFHLATRVACDDPTYVEVPLNIKATIGTNSTSETYRHTLPMRASAASVPDVELTSAVFEKVSVVDGQSASHGVIGMNYTGASENCGFTITTTVQDFVAEEGVISASEMTLVEVRAPAGLTWSIADGQIVAHAAPGVVMPTSGSIEIVVSVPVPEEIESGDYATTISAESGSP